jgi:hypothetical protein
MQLEWQRQNQNGFVFQRSIIVMLMSRYKYVASRMRCTQCANSYKRTTAQLLLKYKLQS